MALLWGNLFVGLLLHVVEPPSSNELEQRAHDAAAAFLALNPLSGDSANDRPQPTSSS